MTKSEDNGPETIRWTAKSGADDRPEAEAPRTALIDDVRDAPMETAVDLDVDPHSAEALSGLGLSAGARLVLWAGGIGMGLIFAGAVGAGLSAVIAAVTRDGGVWSALLLVGAVVLLTVLLVLLLREIVGVLRLGALHDLRRRVQRARREGADPNEAEHSARELLRLYRGRDDTAWAVARLESDRDGDGIADGSTLDAIERQVVGGLDRRCRRLIGAQARRAAAITAVSPFPALDMVATAAVAVSMVAGIARLYGGRPGGLGAWRLARRAFAAVMASGAIDLTEDVVGDMLGASLASRLSRRAGVGVLNGLLMARLGVAAMDQCRPMSWKALARPSARSVLRDALTRDRSTTRDQSGSARSDAAPPP